MTEQRVESVWIFVCKLIGWLIVAAMICATIIFGISIFAAEQTKVKIAESQTKPLYAAMSEFAKAEQYKYMAVLAGQELESQRMQLELNNRRRNIGGGETKKTKTKKGGG